MASQEVIVLNDFGSMRVEERQRTTSEGTTSRYTMTFEGEPIVHDFAAAKLSKIIPEAIAALLKKQISEIGATVAYATEKKRNYAADAIKRNETWAMKRYSGGRTGPIAPSTASDKRMFNDSGRLAQSIAVMQNPKEEGFTINVAANRLNPETFSGGQFQRMIERLRQLAPAFKGGIEVLQDPAVKDAIETAKAEWIVNADRDRRAGKPMTPLALELLKKYGGRYLVRPILGV
jgi:hypothetical protein